MAYNYQLKRYENGTLQLTYYNFPVLDAFDKLKADKSYDDISDRYYDDSFNDSPYGFLDCELDDLEEQKEITLEHLNQEILSQEDIDAKHEHSVRTALSRTKRLIYDYGRNNVWEWFFTFTFNDSAVSDKSDYVECSKKVRKWLNHIRERKCPNMKYLLIPELHKSGEWHFHSLISNVDSMEFEIARNNQEYQKDDNGKIKLNKKGQPILNKYFGQELRIDYPSGDFIYNIKDYSEKRFGWSDATRIKDTRKTVSYIVKYITKDLCEAAFGYRRFYPSNNLTLPVKEFGLFSKQSLEDIVTNIEYQYGVKLSTDYIKTITINSETYENKISYLEFERKEVI